MSTPAAPPATPTPFASASLYVGDLAADVTEALLFEIFNAIGPVASVRVCRDAATRRSLGYAYVNFHRVEDAERALDSMNFTNIRNRPCRIMWSHRDPSLRKSGFGNIFVKNLAKSIDNKALYDTFSIFGNILSCKVAMNSKRESLGYGFVHYESDEAAANAIQRVNGMVIAGQKVNVAPFKSKKERGGADKTKYTNVYVKNLPEDATKEKLDELFSKYGVVTSSMIASGDDEKSRGFGFVNFGTAEEATAACEGLNGYEISPGKRLFVGRAQKKEEREKELRERFEQLKAERQKKYAGVNLYIKNLSDNIDKDRMIAEFSKFGQITSARVMQDEAQKSRGFGFVCYATPEEATKAVTEMNGKMVEGKPLYVALAQRKEVRRAQLEAQHARAKMGVVPPALYPGPQGGPMYFPPQGVHPRMMFPQPMNMPRRWNPSQGQPQPGGPQGGPQQRPQQMLGMPPYVNMGPMARAPVGRGGRGGRGGQQQGSQGKPGQGGRGGRGQGQNGGPNGVPNGQNPNPNFKYTQQVRNRDVQQNQPNQLNAPAAVQVPAQAGKGVLTIQELAAAPEEEQKQMIGERLFPLIQQHEPQLAGKITGMLLEMDNGELLHLLESQEALTEKINEALHVLKEVGQEGGSMVEQDA